MTRSEFEVLVLDTYGIRADYPFEEDFETGVFRHLDSGKWFGIAMHIPYNRIILDADGMVDVVNFKCAPEVVESIATCLRRHTQCGTIAIRNIDSFDVSASDSVKQIFDRTINRASLHFWGKTANAIVLGQSGTSL